jgi:glycosyltransferase involved in cell wall biosynthesis
MNRTEVGSFSMLGWAFNEEESIGAYIERAEIFLKTLTADYELILIDDGSTDKTADIIRAYQQTRPWVRLHQNGTNRGSGYNTKKAIALATKDYLFWQTVDWAYDLTALSSYLHYLKQKQILQGVRHATVSLKGLLFTRSDTTYKGLVSIVNYLLVRTLFQLPLNDYQNVTIYPRQLIQAVNLESESAFTNPECLLKVWWQGASFREFPVPFLKRQQGQAKGTRVSVILKSIHDIFRWWWRWIIRNQRPHRGRGSVIR